MAHGLGAVKEMYLAPFADALSAAGIAVLLFDYRYYGSSGGEPRNQVVPRDQMEDYRNALTWLSLHDQIDPQRLGIWGTSFSGGHVLHIAAYDARVKAVVSQVAAVDLYANAKRVTPVDAFAELWQTAAADRSRRYQGGPVVCMPNAAPAGAGPALQIDNETYAWLTEAQSTVAPSWQNKVTVDSIERILEHAPGLSIDRISPKPLLMILATEDRWTPPDLIREAFGRAGEPKRLLEIAGGHYAVYSGEGQVVAAEAAVAWFTRHLNESEALAA